ncbi:MAG: NAD(+) synthase [Patescibacteria group bacterium]|nr:NAD(+) synthase [Patescibacteria group bacterium]
MKNMPNFDIYPKKETKKIISFLKSIQKKTKKEKVVIGISGGIDSALSLTLLSKAYKKSNIFPVYLPYALPIIKSFDKNLKKTKNLVKKLNLSEENFLIIEIKKPVDKLIDIAKGVGKKGLDRFIFELKECFTCPSADYTNKIRVGNILARVRMIVLFDIAKKVDGLVCGTENRSEALLGYYTRYGDQASDIEPIAHLYKTQVYQLAKFLKIPKEIIDSPASANLWEGQTDEGEFGFKYSEADQVLHQVFDLKKPLNKIDRKKFPNLKKIFQYYKNNEFKKQVPYSLLK